MTQTAVTTPKRVADSRICRLCGVALGKSAQQFNIYKTEEIVESLRRILPSESFSSGDGFPEIVCSVCHRKIKSTRANCERIRRVSTLFNESCQRVDHSPLLRHCIICSKSSKVGWVLDKSNP